METDNFIMEFDNFYSKAECEKLITMYERHAEAGLVLNRQEGQGASSTSVDDTQLFSNDLMVSLEVDVNTCSWVSEFDRLFWK